MKLVIVESPYAGDVKRNTEYARLCMIDCLERGEAPLASHLLYTQVLDDLSADERELGISAGLAWSDVAHLRVLYVDLGVSSGMFQAYEEYLRLGANFVMRRLPERLMVRLKNER